MIRCLRAVLVGGAIGGAGDLAFALANTLAHGKTPIWLLQLIASGAFGQAAFDGGLPMAAAGAAFHFGLAWVWAGLYVVVSRRWRWMIGNPWPSAIAFGTCVFLAMRLVVLPLSAFPVPVSFKPLPSLLDLLSHVFLFALPIAWATRRWCR